MPLTPLASASQPSFQSLGSLLGPELGGSASYAISADGTTVVGGSGSDQSGSIRAFRWRADTGMIDLGIVPAGLVGRSLGYGISADGGVVVGHVAHAAAPPNIMEAFRWTESGGMALLGDLPGGSHFGEARAVSGDGQVVTGFSIGEGDGGQAFRWTAQTGMVPLGGLPSPAPPASRASAISTDGRAIVGRAIGVGGGAFEAFRWTQESGMVGIGRMGRDGSEAHAVNADGAAIAGNTLDVNWDGRGIAEPFRWTESGGIEPLGSINPNVLFSRPVAISADGSAIAGNGGGAWLWTEDGGMRPLLAIFAELDISLPPGWMNFLEVRAMSADGLTLAGIGYNEFGHNVAWVATVPAPPAAPLLLALLPLHAARRRRRAH